MSTMTALVEIPPGDVADGRATPDFLYAYSLLSFPLPDLFALCAHEHCQRDAPNFMRLGGRSTAAQMRPRSIWAAVEPALYMHFGPRADNGESQRDSVAKPGVARNELPWEFVRTAIYPEGVAAPGCHALTQPLQGGCASTTPTQGSFVPRNPGLHDPIPLGLRDPYKLGGAPPSHDQVHGEGERSRLQPQAHEDSRNCPTSRVPGRAGGFPI
jgi:hypothetical protein